MNRLVVSLVFVLLTLLNAGCERAPTDDTSDTVIQSAVEPMTETSLETKIDRTQLSVADRIWVTTTWHWLDDQLVNDVVVTLEDPDWAAADWSLIESITTQPTRDERGYWAQRRVLLEPFLPGDYTIPTSRLLIESSLLDTPVELSIERPISVHVSGVLPESDAGALNPLAPPALPTETDSKPNTMLIIGVSAALAIVACVVIIYVRLQHAPTSSLSVHDQLVQIRDQQNLQRDHAFVLLERAFDRLDPRLRQTTEFAGMIRACERARYAPESDPHTSPSRLAAFTLELLGDDAHPGRQDGGLA